MQRFPTPSGHTIQKLQVMALDIKVLGYGALALALIVIGSCDSFNGDGIDEDKQVVFDQTEFYTQPGVAILIDVKAVIKKSFSSGRLDVLVDPAKGKLETVDTFLLSYIPELQFVEGKDEFTLALVENGDVVSRQIITIIMKDINDLPCGLYAIGDRVSSLAGAPISINFLKNDVFCDTERSTLGVSIHSKPRFGGATMVGDSVIIYTPAASFNGDDQLVYKLTDPDGRSRYGMITITDDWTLTFLKLPGEYFSNIFFVSELIGYVAGEPGFFKTIDGGLNWKEIKAPNRNPPGTGKHHVAFGEIFFLDSTRGFTGFRDVFIGETEFDSYYGYGGVISTEDGGESWNTKLDGMGVTSVFFTSPSTGFVGETGDTEQNGLNNYNVYKTADGGQSWVLVLTSQTFYLGSLKIQFADHMNGYVSHDDKLYVTIDGGETWTLAESGRQIRCITVTPENVLYLSYGDEWAIHRSGGGFGQRTVTGVSYLVSDLEFSPSGNVGFSLGTSGDPDATGRPNMWIGKSIDKGLTWQEPKPVGLFFDSNFLNIAAPSDHAAYVLTGDAIIKYSVP